MSRTLLLFLLLVPRQETLRDLVERALLEEDGVRRKALVEKLGGFPVADVERSIRTPEYKPATIEEGVLAERTIKADYGGEEFVYGVRLPADYDPSKPWPLLVTLHGTNREGMKRMGPIWAATWTMCAAAAREFIIAAPTTCRHTWSSRPGHSHVLTMVRKLVEEFHVDPDRIYLDGMSMGAGGTFDLAQYHPARWAAIAPRCNVPSIRQKKDKSYVPMLCENFRNVPVYWIVGALDAQIPIEMARVGRNRLVKLGYDLTYREFAEGGHDWSLVPDDEVHAWLAKQKRARYPVDVAWKTYEEVFSVAYWIEVKRRSPGLSISTTHVDMTGQPSDERVEHHPPAIVKAKRAGNEFTIECEETHELRIHLTGDMVDFAKEIVVRVNGKEEFRRKAVPAAKTLIEEARRRKDRAMTFSAFVDVKVTDVRKGKYPEESER